ncbi:rho GTPase-activating protein conundrum isoform X2 [Choristoneura fumiferana]|uniref:rho GTPase-activating protein conundrum isoform X2 n=1 Tax=Choristoneura fumiferana TaxID=7141 RepID=UPI003D15F205
MLKLVSPEVRMALPPAALAPDPAALAAYWAEYEELCRQLSSGHPTDDDDNLYEEGELETEWLQAAGLGSLAAPFQAGLEVTEAQLGEAVRPLPREQAAAVRRRVRRLNRTVRRRRAASRARKPDIRDVFRDLENSSGSEPRSRSATPDSLDSMPSGGSGSPPAEWADTHTPPDFVDSFPPPGTHSPLARTPSAPAAPRRARLSPPHAHSPPRPMHELFKPNDLHWADIATNTEGIELLGYQRYGTVQGPRIGKERINGSILKDNDPFVKHTTVSRAKSAASVQQPLSFEHKFNLDRQMMDHEEEWPEDGSSVDVESLSEPQHKRLPPLLWLELTALFDKYSLPFQKRKPPKKKRKEEGSVFGVSLETLLRKDMLLWEETWSSVPGVLRALAAALSARAAHEGLLRVPGNKNKIEALCQLIERSWYSGSRQVVESALANASSHDLAAVFKRLLRSLPQPPLTQELMRLFYHTYSLTGSTQGRALNLLVLLLPAEQRATLRSILQLARDIVAHADTNKMSEHNVAMIIAPALFPPSLLMKQSDSLETQLAMAANSCHVTEALMRWCDQLWLVPDSLLTASQRKPSPHRRNHI